MEERREIRRDRREQRRGGSFLFFFILELTMNPQHRRRRGNEKGMGGVSLHLDYSGARFLVGTEQVPVCGATK